MNSPSLTTRPLSCGHARRILLDDGPRLTSPVLLEARRHLEECADCRAFFADMERIGGAVRASAERLTAPAAIRDRLFELIAHERARPRAGRLPSARLRRALGLVGAAAAILIAAIVGWGILGRDRGASAQMVASLTAEHTARTGSETIETDEPATALRWLSERVPFAVDVPIFPQATLRGARVTLLGGHRSAVVHYTMRTTDVSYFIVPLDDGRAGMTPFENAARLGFRAVIWRADGVLHAFVGGASFADLERLAKLCIDQANRRVASRIESSPPARLFEMRSERAGSSTPFRELI